jgi:two-component system, response regulator PdtaR
VALAGEYPFQTFRMPRRQASKRPIILIAEDDANVRVLAESILAQEYATLSAANAREALALLDEHAVALLFTDVNMPGEPDALDGLELAQRAVEQQPGLKVIYTSGGGQTDGMAALFVEGAIFLTKPYSAQELTEAVQQCLDGRKKRRKPGG